MVQAALPAMALIAVTQGADSSLGQAGTKGEGSTGQKPVPGGIGTSVWVS